MTADLIMALLFALAAGAAGVWGWMERASRLRLQAAAADAEQRAEAALVAQGAAEAQAELELARNDMEDLDDDAFAAAVDAADARLGLSGARPRSDLAGLARREGLVH